MINLENSGIPRDDQIPDLAPTTLRTLSDQIVAAGDASDDSFSGIHQQRPWLRRSALIAAAAAAAVVVTFAVLPSPTAQAWSATPTLAEGTVRADLAADCQDMMDTPAPAVLVEQRGTSNFTVLADSSLCLDVTGLPGLEEGGPLKAGGRDIVPAQEQGADHVQVIHAGSLGGIGIATAGDELADGATTAGYMSVTGRAGADVANIVIHRVGRGDITASLQNGWFAAWWPSLDRPTSLTVTTTTGSYDLDL